MLRVFIFPFLLSLVPSSTFAVKRSDVPGSTFSQPMDNSRRDSDPRVSSDGKITWSEN